MFWLAFCLAPFKQFQNLTSVNIVPESRSFEGYTKLISKYLLEKQTSESTVSMHYECASPRDLEQHIKKDKFRAGAIT